MRVRAGASSSGSANATTGAAPREERRR
jgi:hypothetical protein